MIKKFARWLASLAVDMFSGFLVAVIAFAFAYAYAVAG